MKRRVLAILMAVCMLALMACTGGGDKETKSPPGTKSPDKPAESKEPSEDWSLPYAGEEVHLSIFVEEGSKQIDPESRFGKWYQEQLGNLYTDVEIPAEDSATLMRTYLASGDMPDIMMWRDVKEFKNNYNDGGRTIDLFDYKEYMPEYFQRKEEYPHLSWYDPDENTTYLFGTCWLDMPSEVWFQNQALVDKYDLKIPTNYEEMKANMKIVCDAEPDANGILLIPWGFNYQYTHYGRLHGILSTSWSASSIMWDNDTGKWIYSLFDHPEVYRNAAAEMAEAYENGWIHKDFITMEGDIYNNQLYEGKWLYTFMYDNLTQASLENDYKVPITYIDPPAAEGVTPSIKVDFTSDNWNYSLLTSKKTKYPELCAGLLELVTSKDFAEVYYWGWEGETFERDKDGNPSFKEEWLNMSPEDNLKQVGTQGHYWFHNYVPQSPVADAIANAYAPEVKRSLDIVADKVESGEYAQYYGRGGPDFDQAANDEITGTVNAVATYVEENLTNFVLGRKPMSEWDDFIAGISGVGDMNRVLELYNSAEPGPIRPTQFERKYIRP